MERLKRPNKILFEDIQTVIATPGVNLTKIVYMLAPTPHAMAHKGYPLSTYLAKSISRIKKQSFDIELAFPVTYNLKQAWSISTKSNQIYSTSRRIREWIEENTQLRRVVEDYAEVLHYMEDDFITNEHSAYYLKRATDLLRTFSLGMVGDTEYIKSVNVVIPHFDKSFASLASTFTVDSLGLAGGSNEKRSEDSTESDL